MKTLRSTSAYVICLQTFSLRLLICFVRNLSRGSTHSPDCWTAPTASDAGHAPATAHGRPLPRLHGSAVPPVRPWVRPYHGAAGARGTAHLTARVTSPWPSAVIHAGACSLTGEAICKNTAQLFTLCFIIFFNF